MKKIFIATLCFLFLFSCKKRNSNATDLLTYDTSLNKHTGLKAPSLAQILAIPVIDTSLVPVFGSRVMSLDTKCELEVPPPLKQSYNNCAAWAVGYGMLSYQYKVLEQSSSYDHPNNTFSPAYIYNQIIGPNDDGIYLIDALKLVKNQGCSKYFDFPEHLVPSFTTKPDAVIKEKAAAYKIDEFYRIETLDINLIKFFLSVRKYPIPFGARIDDGFKHGLDSRFWDERLGKRYVWKKKSENGVGTHGMLICGYDDAINAFKVLNSWGPRWGKNEGYTWIDYDFFKTIVLSLPSGNFDNPDMYFAITKKYSKITIDAKATWTNSGITIKNGKKYNFIQVAGGWSVDKNNYQYVSADGHTNEANTPLANYYSIKSFSGAYFGTLLGKIGNNIFKIGANFNGTIPYDGALYLQINDEARADNGGEVTIKITEN